jgi:hypothetical protein
MNKTSYYSTTLFNDHKQSYRLSNEISIMVNQTVTESEARRTHLLWRCANTECNTFHVRTTRLTWNREIQSPCPKCHKRTRLNEGNTRAYESKEDALNAKEMASGRWL